MKITQQRLKEIIKEEMEALKVEESKESEQEATNRLRNFLETNYPETELMSHLDPNYYDEFGGDESYIIVNNDKKVTGIRDNERADMIARDINKNFGSSIKAHMQNPKFAGGPGPHGTVIMLQFKGGLEERGPLALASQAPQMQEEAPPDMFGDPDEEGGMARGELFKIGKYAVELRKMLQNDDQLPAWVQSKITKCAMLMGDVKHFLEGEMAAQSDDMAPEQEELGLDEIESIVSEQLDAVLEAKKKLK